MQMETREEKAGNREQYLLKIIRRVTYFVKFFPFFYAVGLLLLWLIAPLLSTEAVIEIDSLIFISALMVLFLICLSFCVRLCIWHRLQCALPLLPQVSAHIDQQVYKFGSYTATANAIAMMLILALTLINAYFVFIKPTVRK